MKKCKCGKKLELYFKTCRDCNSKGRDCIIENCQYSDFDRQCLCKHHLFKYQKSPYIHVANFALDLFKKS